MGVVASVADYCVIYNGGYFVIGIFIVPLTARNSP